MVSEEKQRKSVKNSRSRSSREGGRVGGMEGRGRELHEVWGIQCIPRWPGPRRQGGTRVYMLGSKSEILFIAKGGVAFCSWKGTGNGTGWVMKASLRIDPNCYWAVVLERSWGKHSLSLSFPQLDVQAADTRGGLCGEIGSFQVRIESFQFRECLPAGTLLSEGGVVASARKWECPHWECPQRTPTPASHWISWDLWGGGWSGAWTLGSASFWLGDFRQVA